MGSRQDAGIANTAGKRRGAFDSDGGKGTAASGDDLAAAVDLDAAGDDGGAAAVEDAAAADEGVAYNRDTIGADGAGVLDRAGKRGRADHHAGDRASIRMGIRPLVNQRVPPR